MHIINDWYHLTSFQVLLLGMMLMMTVFSLIHYLAFRIQSSGLRFVFNLGVIAGVLLVGMYQAGICTTYTYYLATNVITLGSAVVYMQLLYRGMDMHLYEPTLANGIRRLKQHLPLLVSVTLFLDIVLNTYTMSILIIVFCTGLLWSMARIWHRNKRLPFYIHLFTWGAAILLLASMATFSLKFAEVSLKINNQTLVHYFLFPALSLEFVTFAAGDMLRLRHATLMRDKLLTEIKHVRGTQRDQESLSLAYRLNTHTLANVLNRIQHSLLKHDATVAMNLMHDYSSFLRSTLQLDECGSHTIREEADLLRRYLELSSTLLGPGFSYRISVEADPALQIPCMICLPGVENAVIHGFGDARVNKPQIEIRFKQEGALLIASISDNGRGIPETMRQENRFGLQNTRKRLALLSEKTGIAFTYRLENCRDKGADSSGACLMLGIPILTAKTPNFQHKKTTT